MPFFDTINYQPTYSPARLKWDVEKQSRRKGAPFTGSARFQVLPPSLFERPENIWLEVGSGSGSFFAAMSALYPDRFLIAMERCKLRGQRLERKVAKTARPNLVGFRGNAIPALVHGVPSGRLERIYILYPCPWPKNAQRKNRWYLHPMMPHLVRALQPGGLLLWASDQKFYIDEARWICENVYGLQVLVHGEVSPNPYNDLERFSGGRSKFERSFLESGQPCYELVARLSDQSTNKSGNGSTPGCAS